MQIGPSNCSAKCSETGKVGYKKFYSVMTSLDSTRLLPRIYFPGIIGLSTMIPVRSNKATNMNTATNMPRSVSPIFDNGLILMLLLGFKVRFVIWFRLRLGEYCKSLVVVHAPLSRFGF